MALGLILSVFGLGSLWVLLFRASTYAVPIFVGLTAGWCAFNAGAGPIGAFVLGAGASGAFLAASQATFSLSRSLLLRRLIALLFAGPAAYIGVSPGAYHSVVRRAFGYLAARVRYRGRRHFWTYRYEPPALVWLRTQLIRQHGRSSQH